VVSGGNEFWGREDARRDRLYLNDGRGNFTRAIAAIPDYFENGGCVVAGDFNGDGHPDLFVGSRVVTRSYGSIPMSHLLQNDGAGHFVDVTSTKAPALAAAGMVSSAAWVDYDGDRKLDLIVAGEWMPVRVFHQERGRFVDRTKQAGLSASNGWWNSISAVDLRGNGRRDLVLGNVGLNSYLKPSSGDPARMYLGDFAHNGVLQQIITSFKNGVSYPVAGHDEIIRLNPELRARYPTYKDFGGARVEDIFPGSDLKKAQVREAFTFSSAIARNNGNGTFTLQRLPPEAQFAPVYASVAEDFDGDGKTDLLVAGNLYGVMPTFGRYDASYSQLLRGTGNGRFAAVELEKSGVVIDGEVRHMKPLRGAKGARLIAIARNNDRLEIVRLAEPKLRNR
jgi:hypothetical protein